MKESKSIDWCDVIIKNDTDNSSSEPYVPLCVVIETYTGLIDPVRVSDVIILFLNVAFLALLAVRFVPTIRKLMGAWPLFSILYCQVLVIPVLCSTHEIVSMILDHHHLASKVTHYMLRGAILTAEISVVMFGLTFKYYQGQKVKLVLTMCFIVLFSCGYTITEGVLDGFWKHHIVCDTHNLFTHGGMIFYFVTSSLLSIAYMLTFLLYILNIYKRWNLPSKKSFYRYALFLSFVNIFQAIGSMLWFNGLYHKKMASAGICITTVTTDIYLITFAPVVYWIFLRNYFRMNTAVSSPNSAHVNTDALDDSRNSSPKKWWLPIPFKNRGSNPVPIYKQILQDESTHLLHNDGSVSSSVDIGSYMSAKMLITS